MCFATFQCGILDKVLYLIVGIPDVCQFLLKKIKTKFLRCTGYLNSIKNPIKQDLLQILILVQQQNFLNC